MVLVSDFAQPGTFMAICKECPPILPLSFDDKKLRDAWVITHRRATQHEVIVVNGPKVDE